MAGNFSINDFRSKIKGDLLRPSLFKATIIGPPASNFPGQDATFLIQSVTIPPAVIGNIQVYYGGSPVNFAGDRQNQNIDMTMLVDENTGTYDALYKWSNAMSQNSRKDSMRTDYADSDPFSYTSTLVIDCYGKPDEIIKTYKIHNAFPIFISPLNLNMAAVNQAAMVSVSWVYDWFENVGATN